MNKTESGAQTSDYDYIWQWYSWSTQIHNKLMDGQLKKKILSFGAQDSEIDPIEWNSLSRQSIQQLAYQEKK